MKERGKERVVLPSLCVDFLSQLFLFKTPEASSANFFISQISSSSPPPPSLPPTLVVDILLKADSFRSFFPSFFLSSSSSQVVSLSLKKYSIIYISSPYLRGPSVKAKGEHQRERKERRKNKKNERSAKERQGEPNGREFSN
jgi:hypothetical protein